MENIPKGRSMNSVRDHTHEVDFLHGWLRGVEGLPVSLVAEAAGQRSLKLTVVGLDCEELLLQHLGLISVELSRRMGLQYFIALSCRQDYTNM